MRPNGWRTTRRRPPRRGAKRGANGVGQPGTAGRPGTARRAAKASGYVHAAKLYPAGATTNSASGVTRIDNIFPVLEAMAEVGLPLLYIDGDGKRREIKDRTEVEAVFDEIFDPAMIEVLQKIDLSRMSVAKDQGGFFELGAIWLVVDRDGGRPRLMTVNRQALDEALDTARERADRNQGEPVPFD